MLTQLSLSEFLALAKTAEYVTVHQEISADRLTPVGIVESLQNEMQQGTLLESGLHGGDAGRYSFIAFDAMAELRAHHNVVSTRIGETITTHTAHPFTVLRELLSRFSPANGQPAVHFSNGAVGFITYDAIRLFESIPDRHFMENTLPDMLFHFYKTTLMFDHSQQKLLIKVVVNVGADPLQAYQATQEYINLTIKKIHQTQPNTKVSTNKKDSFPVDIDINDETFMALIKRAKQHIIAGDAFQIVLSRCFKKRYTATPFDIYRALRRISPAPYMFYFPTEQGVMLGASPEKLVSVCDGQVEVNPIAGTRARTAECDEAIANELLQDTKELAEHMMLVDLARNDVGMVCEPGSVKVSNLAHVKHFSHVSHLTSTVTGRLQKNKDALDVLAAAFPAGTLSGAPKIRAMQIIDSLETSRRGLYGGAICRLDYQGNLDSCIAIRMALLKDNVATVRTGAGIVYDSDPRSEAEETRQKATGVLEAIALAEGELT